MPSHDQRPSPGELPLGAVADALSDGIAVCREGRVVFANARLREWLGRAELEGAAFADLFEGGEAPEPGRARACQLRRPDAPRRVEVRGHPVAAGDTLFVLRDVTHVQGLEEELLRSGRALHTAQRELERARERSRRESEEREDLLTVVAHELRTPATVISGYNRLLLSEKVGPLGEEQRRFLEESSKSCQRLNAFIGNLLEASRQAAGDAPLELREASLAPTLEGVAAYLKPLLEARGLEVRVDVDPRASLARFDPVRLEQVMTNLVSNALKYAPEGSAIELRTRALRERGLPFVEIAVVDEGEGVAPEDRERIFLPYVRTGADRAAGGLGLGLAICKRIVEAHGGRIGVEPLEDGRNAFRITLPAPSGGARAGGGA